MMLLDLGGLGTPNPCVAGTFDDGALSQATTGAYVISPVRSGDGVRLWWDPLDTHVAFTAPGVGGGVTSLISNSHDEIRVDGVAGQVTVRVDFSEGSFELSPADPDVRIVGEDPRLGNTLVVVGGPLDDRFEVGPGTVVFGNATGTTVVIYGAGVTQVIFELGGGNDVIAPLVPEVGGIVGVGGAVLAVVARRRRS